MEKIIPIMHCFDNNYVLPASVAFYSLLENANKEFYYKIYVLHNDITRENQEKLKKNIEIFKNSELIFIDMKDRFSKEWKNLKTKGHFSKEMFYKLFAPSIFKEYKKMIISDVDVIYKGDISKEYKNFDINEDYYFAGVNMVETIDTKEYFEKEYYNFSKEEKEKLKYAAGYLILNLDMCRRDNIEEKFLECFHKNYMKLKQPEQDILSLCCYPKIKKLGLNSLVCSYMYKKGAYDYLRENKKLSEEIEDALENPIQLHYATQIKPWNDLSSLKATDWFKELTKTIFIEEYLVKIQENLNKLKHKKIISIKIPYKRKKELVFEIIKQRKELNEK